MHRAETVAKAAIEENRLKLTVVPDLRQVRLQSLSNGFIVCLHLGLAPARTVGFFLRARNAKLRGRET